MDTAPMGNAPDWSRRTGLARYRFVGRADEMAWLEFWFDEVVAGEPRVALVEGDAGIGKSRLVTQFLEQLSERGIRVLRGACMEDGFVPYLPIATALAPHVDWPPAVDGTVETADVDRRRLELFLSASRAVL